MNPVVVVPENKIRRSNPPYFFVPGNDADEASHVARRKILRRGRALTVGSVKPCEQCGTWGKQHFVGLPAGYRSIVELYCGLTNGAEQMVPMNATEFATVSGVLEGRLAE